MEKRLLLAVLLMAAAIMVTNLIFPPPETPEALQETEPVGGVVVPSSTAPAPGLSAIAPLEAAEVVGDSVVIENEVATYVFDPRGAALRHLYLRDYRSYSMPGEPVQLVPEGSTDFLGHLLVVGRDTIDLRRVPFASVTGRSGTDGATVARFSSEEVGGLSITLEYTFEPGDYLVRARGRIDGLQGREALLLSRLGPRLELHEHPEHHSEQEFAAVVRRGTRVERLPFRRVEGREELDGSLGWAGIKDKYFLGAVLGANGSGIRGATLQRVSPLVLPSDGKELSIPQVELTVATAVESGGDFAFDLYLGPQDYSLLSRIGYDLEEVTPYGYRWLQPFIRPLAAGVLWVLNTLHDTLGIAYGWVLVLFGVMMRVVLWPLNAKAMRAQMKNMAVQPLMQEIREKYKNDPQKQQEAMLGLYKEHGFNPLAGCLPMLVPFPVLITLFFVFRNTIALRGAEFLWLPDLSLRDPLYILPAVLVISMFALQWVSAQLSGIEQNPQMKMMMYFMPIMMGMIFFMLPAGLNLYYAVTQVASIPQQVLIAKERRLAQEALKKAPPKLPGVGSARRKR